MTALTGGRVGRLLLRGVAIVLALATALSLMDFGTANALRPPIELAVRAFTIGVVLQLGLYWATTARGWQCVGAAILMLPTTLIFVILLIDALTRIVSGAPFNYPVTLAATLGVVIYAAAYAIIMRQYRTERAANASSDRRG